MLTLREVPEALKSFYPFQASNLHAVKLQPVGKAILRYQVWSYATCIAHVIFVDGQVSKVYLNNHKYSSTTSKQQNIIRKAWSRHNIVEVPAEVFETIRLEGRQ